MQKDVSVIVIGGSSGSIPVLLKLLNALPAAFHIPIVIVVHRLQNVNSELETILSLNKPVKEPEDKEPLLPGHIYLAPQNYHLLVEEDKVFSMDYSEKVNFSRPSIDVAFSAIAAVFGCHAMAVLLSGANKDGAEGCAAIIARGGRVVIQDPVSAEYPQMPDAAIALNSQATIKTPSAIIEVLLQLTGN